jgi:hypothetical protein
MIRNSRCIASSVYYGSEKIQGWERGVHVDVGLVVAPFAL